MTANSSTNDEWAKAKKQATANIVSHNLYDPDRIIHPNPMYFTDNKSKYDTVYGFCTYWKFRIKTPSHAKY